MIIFQKKIVKNGKNQFLNNHIFLRNTNLEIISTLSPKDLHINLIADILVVAIHTDRNSVRTMFSKNKDNQWKVFKNLKQISVYKRQTVLNAQHTIYVHQFHQIPEGKYELFTGYRLKDGSIIYNEEDPGLFWIPTI